MGKVLKGYDEIQIGAVQTTAYPGATGNSSWTGTKLGLVTTDGITLAQGEPKSEDLRECGNYIPVDNNVTPGDPANFTGAVLCTVGQELVDLLGGTLGVDGWEAPSEFDPIYGGFLIKTKDSAKSIAIPNGLLTAWLDGKLGETGSVNIKFKIAPLDAGSTLKPFKFTK